MTANESFGKNLKDARLQMGLTQARLARSARVHRLRLLRIERGALDPSLSEVLQICQVLKIPVERLISGRWRPSGDLRGIALELFHLGIQDLQVASPHVPGAFRRPEQVLVLAIQGDRPEPRIVEAIPFVLARRRISVPLALAFAKVYEPRARHRLAWLSDITLALSRLGTFPVELRWERQLSAFIRAAEKPDEPDSLGHPGERKLPAVSRRWNVTYAGGLHDFLERVREVHAAYVRFRNPPEIEE